MPTMQGWSHRAVQEIKNRIKEVEGRRGGNKKELFRLGEALKMAQANAATPSEDDVQPSETRPKITARERRKIARSLSHVSTETK